MIKVYIASPYTIGDVAVNVKRQLDTANELMNEGYNPFVPLYSHFQHMIHPRPYEDWVKIDLEWVSSCDCVLRLSGESKGADGEVDYAKGLGIPVVYSIEELNNLYQNRVWYLKDLH
jgi:nucleoside 2-deoxyribosyltransferase